MAENETRIITILKRSSWNLPPAQVSEIKKVAREDPALAADGTVKFIEKLVPAIEARSQ